MRRKSPLVRLRESWQLYLCILPAMTYLFIFHYLPIYGLQIAFRDYMPGLGITSSPWVGLTYFERFFQSFQLPVLLRNTILINIYTLLIAFPIPIVFALLLNEVKNLPYKKIVQNITYIPHFISTVVLVSMIILFTSPTIGAINKMIGFFGQTPIDFMGQSQWFRTLLIGSDIWQSMGWNSIIYIAALSGIDPQLHEAACMDGANRLRRIWHINLPGIAPIIIMLLILRCGSLMNVGFEKVYLLQNTLNLDVSEVISTYVYKTGLLGAKFSYTAAIGLFNTMINFIFLIIVNRVSRAASSISLF